MVRGVNLHREERVFASLRSNPKRLGLLVTAAGTVTLLVALVKDRGALAMSPGVEGCLTAGIVAIALALSEGLSYSTCLMAVLPVAFAQYLGCRAAGESALAVLGLEGLIIGLFGLVAGRFPALGDPRTRRTAREDKRYGRSGCFSEPPRATPLLLPKTPWRGGRVAEGTRLLSVRSGN